MASEPACMSCKVQFQYDFLIENLPITFWHSEYKNFRKSLLLSKEESLLPETQNCVVRIKRKDAFYQHVKAFRAEIDKMFQHYNKLMGRMTQMSEMITRERQGREEIPDDHPFFLYFNDDNTPMKDENGQLICMKDDVSTIEKKIRRPAISNWVHACPKLECRGYLKGDQTICSICSTRVCKDCLKIQDDQEEHECQKADVETVEMLKQNTKACPNCSMSIYKISGCDQMWCTQCRTPFSWRTGQRIHQRIHNPHYYEWMQRHQGEDMPRELMDIPCGGLPSINRLRMFPYHHLDWVYRLHQYIVHCDHIVLPRYQNNTQFDETCKTLRISYLLNHLSRDTWRDELYREEKASQKHQQYLQIIQTFVTVSSDWLRRMVMDMPSNIDEEIKNTVGFLSYINGQIRLLNSRFKSNLSLLPDSLLHL